MSLLKHLKAVYSWNKFYYLSTAGLTSVSGILYYIDIDVLSLITYPLVMIALVTTFISFKRDFFSFKYLQSLPLTKQELFNLKIGESLVNLAPLFFWGIVFSPIVWELFSDLKMSGPIDFLKLFAAYSIGAALVSIWSFYIIYEGSRSAFVKSERLVAVRTFIYYFAGSILVIYACIISAMLLQTFNAQLLLDIFSFLQPLKSMWGLIALGFIFIHFEYHRVFRRWLEEKRSYVKNNWKPLKDIPLIALAIALVILPPAYIINGNANRSVYGKSSLLEAIRNKNMVEIDRLLKDGANINSKSSTGYSPLMAAAHLGDEKIYFYLLSKGALKEGSLKAYPHYDLAWLSLKGGNEAIVRDIYDNKLANHPVDGVYPLHQATLLCKERIIDLLLELGADPNVRITNKKKDLGQTPLHLASKWSCMNGAVSLVDAGAKLDIRDSIGKLASAYVKDWNKNLNYYMERKSRSPAGK